MSCERDPFPPCAVCGKPIVAFNEGGEIQFEHADMSFLFTGSDAPGHDARPPDHLLRMADD